MQCAKCKLIYTYHNLHEFTIFAIADGGHFILSNLYSIMDDLKVDEQEAMNNTHKYLRDLILTVKNDFSLD